MELTWALDLGDVTGGKRHVLGLWDRVADVPLEGVRDERILAAPDEQRRRLEFAQALPEALGLLEVDVAGGRIEGRAPPSASTTRCS